MAKGSNRNQARAAAQAKKSTRVAKRNASSGGSSGGNSGGSSGGNSGGGSSNNNSGSNSSNNSNQSNSRQQAKNKVQARLGDDKYKNVSQAGLQDATKQGSYSAAEVKAEFRNRGDSKVNEGEGSILQRFQDAQEGGATFNKKAQNYLSEKYGMTFGKKEKEEEEPTYGIPTPVKTEPAPYLPDPNANVDKEPPTTGEYKPPATNIKTPTITVNPPFPGTEGGGGGGNITPTVQTQDQNVSQDNDITNTITGDGNTVTNNVDNSVRQYGGINKNFVYNGSSNGKNYMDTPVSAGTMGGYFHDGDSPGKSASFVDRYQTMNRDYQQQFKDTGYANKAINQAAQTSAIDVGALDQRVNDRAKLSRARSTNMAGSIFGDMFNYKPAEFTPAKYDDEDEDK